MTITITLRNWHVNAIAWGLWFGAGWILTGLDYESEGRQAFLFISMLMWGGCNIFMSMMTMNKPRKKIEFND